MSVACRVVPCCVLPCPAAVTVSDVEICRSLARTAISSSLDCVNPCGLPPEDRLLLSMSPHVVVTGAWEQEERNAAHKQQQQQQQRQWQPEQQQHQQLAEAPGSSLEADLAMQLSLSKSPLAQHMSNVNLRAAVAACTEQQHLSSKTAAAPPCDPLTTSQHAAGTYDPLGADPLSAAAAGAAEHGRLPGCAAASAGAEAQAAAGCAATAAGAEAQAAGGAATAAGVETPAAAGVGEPEFTDPLRRRTLQGDEGLLGEGVGLSEDAMVEQEAQDAAALAALADLPHATQGLQLYDR